MQSPSKPNRPLSRLAILYRAIAGLKPDTRNARIHAPIQVRQIAHSIQVFGFLVPVLIDAHGNILAGHGRVLAAQYLGMTEIPTILVEHLSQQQIRAFRIADNRLTENSRWDKKLLAGELRDLSLENLNFDLDVTGFSVGEIDLQIAELEVAAEPDSADDVPAPTGIAVAKVGDVWLLDSHRLHCGNALEPSAFDSLMGGKTAVAAYTDPPYNVPIEGHVTGNGAVHHREFAYASGEMSSEEFVAFLKQVFRLLVQYSINGSLHYIFMDWRHMQELLKAGIDVYTELKNLCVWVKSHGGMGSFYRSQHELIFVFKSGTGAHLNNIQLGKNGRNRTNVWQYASPSSFGRSTEEGKLLALHPTAKSVSLVADAILDGSKRGGIVVDPFLGSGTTLIAAQRTGRICYGMEIDPLYTDTAIRRWQAFTGGVARHEASGLSFDEIQQQREASA